MNSITDCVLAFDPGDTTGVAQLNMSGGLLWFDQMNLSDLIAWAGSYEPAAFKPVVIVVERFIVFRQKAHTQVGSKMVVSQAIGVIKTLASRLEVPVVEQNPDKKTPALAWTGIKMPSQHSQTHKWDAFLHGYYWLRENGYVKSQHKGLLSGDER